MLEGRTLQSPNAQLSYLQFLVEILDVCREPQTRSQLISLTGISLKRLHYHLKHLVKQNLIKFHHRKRTYVTTEKGLRFLQMYKKLE